MGRLDQKFSLVTGSDSGIGRAIAIQFAREGATVVISSVHEDLAMPQNAPYCCAKGGIRLLMRTIALELAPYNITVNNIAPGAIDTPIDADMKADLEKMKALLAEIPLHRMGQPESGGTAGALPGLRRLRLRHGLNICH